MEAIEMVRKLLFVNMASSTVTGKADVTISTKLNLISCLGMIGSHLCANQNALEILKVRRKP